MGSIKKGGDGARLAHPDPHPCQYLYQQTNFLNAVHVFITITKWTGFSNHADRPAVGQTGYGNLAVTLDGSPVANAGTIAMTSSHTLAATAVIDVRGTWNGKQSIQKAQRLIERPWRTLASTSCFLPPPGL